MLLVATAVIEEEGDSDVGVALSTTRTEAHVDFE